MITIYSANCSFSDSELLPALELLSPSRRERTSGIKNAKARLQSLAAGLLLHHVLPGAEISYDENGKPFLPGMSLSLSHSGDIAVLACGSTGLGVDIEVIGAIRPKVAARCFTAEEREWTGIDPVRFFRIWTRKESIMKATGLGLRLPPGSFSVLKDTCGPWRLQTKIYKGCVLSAAYSGPCQEIRLEHVPKETLLLKEQPSKAT